MTNPTSNFGWQMPTSTDLVTDLPADFAVFGQAVDTSMADLKGGTTGQILAKATNTDMDFTWITNDQGDITAVNTTAPLAGGGTSGALTLSIASATTSVSGAVQLSDSTSTTSSVLAATPTAVKSAYDLAAAAIPKSTVTTAGDVIYATGSSTVSRLGLGTAGQVLTVNTGATAPEWTTPAGGGGGKVLQVVQGSYSTSKTVATTTYTDTDLSLSITPTSATSKVLIIVTQYGLISRDNTDQGHGLRILRGATEVFTTGATNGAGYIFNAGSTSIEQGIRVPLTYLDSPATTSATTYKTQGRPLYTTNSGQVVFQHGTQPSVITLMEIGA
jgi:hypothetical protein